LKLRIRAENIRFSTPIQTNICLQNDLFPENYLFTKNRELKKMQITVMTWKMDKLKFAFRKKTF